MSRPKHKNPSVWVLYDANAEHTYIKMYADDGSLAVFDNEEYAKKAKSIFSGTDYVEGVLTSKNKHDQLITDAQGRLDAMRLAIQGFVDAWTESYCYPDTFSEIEAIDQAFNECKKALTAELKREPVGGDV